jgi:hypothetical protein
MAKHEINTINQTSEIPVKNGSRNVFANLAGAMRMIFRLKQSSRVRLQEDQGLRVHPGASRQKARLGLSKTAGHLKVVFERRFSDRL